MVQTSLFANIAALSALNVFTFISSRLTADIHVTSVPFKVIVPKTNQLTHATLLLETCTMCSSAEGLGGEDAAQQSSGHSYGALNSIYNIWRIKVPICKDR